MWIKKKMQYTMGMQQRKKLRFETSVKSLIEISVVKASEPILHVSGMKW